MLYSCLALLLLLAGCSNPDADRTGEIRQIWDVAYIVNTAKQSWSLETLPETGWQSGIFPEINTQGHEVWIRASLDIPDIYEQKSTPLGLQLSALAAAEIYLNGAFLARNGRPSPKADQEKPGRMDTVFFIPPDRIQPGQNEFVFRLSTQSDILPLYNNLYSAFLTPYRPAQSTPVKFYLPSIGMAGVFIFGAVVFIFRYISGRRRAESLWLTLAMLFALGQMGAEVWRAFDAYIYPLHYLRILLIYAFALGFGTSLLAFAGHRFLGRFPRTALIAALAASLAIFVLVPGFDGRTSLTLTVFFILSLVLAVKGLRKGVPYTRPFVLAFLVVILLIIPGLSLFIDRYYYFSIAFLLITLFMIDVLIERQISRDMHAISLQSARLELELVKRHIQPHFLVNTLTALAEWMEESPKTAGKMIDALTEEFRLLHEMVEKKTVALSTEIRLCKAHLELLGYRRGHSYRLRTETEVPDAPVPPAIFHTLIENAVTHSRYGRRDIEFRLKQTADRDGWAYVFSAPLAEESARAAAVKGLGSAYIETRLAEAFGQGYSFHSGPEDAFWTSRIKISRDKP